MNEANPFRFPTWSQINREQRRRERFKKTVILAVAAAALLLVGLLMLGHKTRLAAKEIPSTTEPQTTRAAAPAPTPVPAPTQTTTTVPSRSATVYVVKSGDTLSRIAKAHGTTITAITSANHLTSDRITVGQQLKMP